MMKNFVINRKGNTLTDTIKKQKEVTNEIQYLRNVADDDSTPSNLSKSYVGMIDHTSASMTGLVDASNLVSGEKQNSNLTSNVDSVLSYMGADKKEMSERSDAVVQAADASEYRIDLRLLNAELNASVHSENSIARLKQNIKPAPKGQKKHAVLPAQESTGANDVFAELDSMAREQVEFERQQRKKTPTNQAVTADGVPFFSFVQRKANGTTVQKSRPLFSGKHYITAINQKYADESSMLSNNLGEDGSSLCSGQGSRASSSAAASDIIPVKKTVTPCSFVASGSRTKTQRQLNRTNVLESGVTKNKSQRKAMGRDVRYQLKTLESASVMESDDFFAGDFSKQRRPDLLVKSNSSAAKSTEGFNNNGVAAEEDTEMTEDENGNQIEAVYRPLHFWSRISCPVLNIGNILGEKQPSGRRLKRNAGLAGQLKAYLTSQSGESDLDARSATSEAQPVQKLTGRVLSIEQRLGMISLICEKLSELSGQATPMKESLSQQSDPERLMKCEKRSEESKVVTTDQTDVKEQSACVGRQVFRVLLNPILSQLEISVGEIVTIHGVNLSVTVSQASDMTSLFVRQVVWPQVIENLGFKSESATTASAISQHDQQADKHMATDDNSSVSGSIGQD